MRGGDSNGIRAYNERLIVSAILAEGPLSKAALARSTGLSANAAMVIANRLVEDGFLRKGKPVRGQVGQPSTPIEVNPAGAFAIGITIGRRSTQALLVDFMGRTVGWRETAYAYPQPAAAIATAKDHCRDLLSALQPADHSRVVGLGIAMPGEMDAWTDELGAPKGSLAGWRDVNVAQDLSDATGLDTMVFNDASAACAAEMIAGKAIVHQSALYIFFGTFIGGGVVIDGKLYQGVRQNAGAIGSMPTVADPVGPHDNQLIHCASLLQLEALLADGGFQPQNVILNDSDVGADAAFQRWMDMAVPEVAGAIVSALCVIDFEAVVIDGGLNARWRAGLAARIETEVAGRNLSGLIAPDIITGTVGPMAPVRGAAMMPLRRRFSPDPDLIVSRSR